MEVDYGSTVPSTTTAPIKVNNYSVGTGLTLKVAGVGFSAGQDYPLVTWTGSGPANTNAFTTLDLPASPAVTGYLSVSGNTLYLNVVTVSALSWNTGDGDWDTITQNWMNIALNLAANYTDPTDAVLFNDAAGVGVGVNPVRQPDQRVFAVGCSDEKFQPRLHHYEHPQWHGQYRRQRPVDTGCREHADPHPGHLQQLHRRHVRQRRHTGVERRGHLGQPAGSLTLSGGRLDLGGLTGTKGAVNISAAAASGDTITNGTLSATSYAASNPGGNAIVSAILARFGHVHQVGRGHGDARRCRYLLWKLGCQRRHAECLGCAVRNG